MQQKQGFNELQMDSNTVGHNNRKGLRIGRIFA